MEKKDKPVFQKKAEVKELIDKINRFLNGRIAVEEIYNSEKENKDNLRATVELIDEKIQILQEKIKERIFEIDSIQRTCKHLHTTYVGNNHNDNIFECTECGARFHE